jgi:hypothetical protein
MTWETIRSLRLRLCLCLWSPLTVRLLIAMNALSLLSSQIPPMLTCPSTSSRCATSRELRMHALSLLGKMMSIMPLPDWVLSTPLQCMCSTLSAVHGVAKSTFEMGVHMLTNTTCRANYDAVANNAACQSPCPSGFPLLHPCYHS